MYHNHNVNVNVNVEFKVTLHEQVRCRGTLQYKKLQSDTQLDTMVKSTMTETVPSSGHKLLMAGYSRRAAYRASRYIRRWTLSMINITRNTEKCPKGKYADQDSRFYANVVSSDVNASL